ncbi:hypothetical protein HER39_09510, partial [Arthrobacter deserti]|nr:hypothetical protein [Arthrobacter deserti]
LGRSTSDGAAEHNLDTPYYVLAVLGHMAATAYLMAQVVRPIRHPGRDVVRRLETDDPQAGPFDGAPDRFVLRGLLTGSRPARLRKEATP